MEKLAILPFEIILIVADIIAITIPSNIYIIFMVLFYLACFSE
jgi:hypothetical protein